MNNTNFSPIPKTISRIRGPRGINPIKSFKSWFSSFKIPRSKKQRNSFFKISLISLICLISLIGFVFFIKKPAKAVWYDSAYKYRQKIDITNSGSSLTNFQVSVTLNTSSLVSAGKMQSNCADLRLTDKNGTALPYWIETATNICNSTTTVVWTKLTTVPIGITSIYVYYGNSSAADAQSASSVFINYFDYTSAASWTCDADHHAANSSGELWIYSTADAGARCYIATTSVNYDVVTELRARAPYKGYTYLNMNYFIPEDSKDSANYFAYYTFPTGSTNSAIQATDKNGSTTLIDPQANDAYYRAQIVYRFSASKSDFHIFDANNVSVANATDLDINAHGTTDKFDQLDIGDFTAGTADGQFANMYYSWIFTRKYAATPPTTTVSSYEEQNTDPIAYWKFDEGYGTTTYDSTANAINGTLGTGSSAPSWTSSDLCISGKCLKFDGTNDYVDAGGASSLSFSNTITVSAWIKKTSAGSTYQGVVDKGRDDYGAWSLNVDEAAGKATFKARINGTNRSIVAQTAYTVGSWNHIVGVYDGSNLRIYQNGILSNSAAYSGALGTNSLKVYIGAANSTSNIIGLPFSGQIDDVKIYRYARSAVQVKADYAAGKASAGNGKGADAALGAPPGAGGAFSNGLVGYWKMDETSGNLTDSSGNGGTGTVTGTTVVNGKFGNGRNFNGSTEKALVADNDIYSINTTNKFTVAGWFYPTALSGSQDAIAKGGAASYEWSLRFQGTAPEAHIYNNGGSDILNVISSTTVSNNQWVYVAMTVDLNSPQIAIFVNGVQTGSSTSLSGTYGNSTANLSFAIRDDLLAKYTGRIDETRIYNRALSPAEIQALYKFSPNPIAYYKFEEGSGTTVNDSSGNGLTGTRTGSGTTQYVSGKAGKAGNFNGTDDVVTVTDNSTMDITGPFTLEGWVLDPPLASPSPTPTLSPNINKNALACVDDKIELIDKRTQNSKLFVKKGTNQYEMESSLGPIHYKDNPQDESEPWKNINTTLILEKSPLICRDDNYDYSMREAPYHVSFKNDFTENNIVKLESQGESILVKPQNLYLDNKLVSKPQESKAKVTGNEILWKSAYGQGLDFKWIADNVTLFKRLIVNNINSLPAPANDKANLTLGLNFKVSPGVKPVIKSNTVEFVKGNETLWRFMDLKAWDSKDSNITMKFDATVIDDNNLFVKINLPYSWIKKAVFPIYVDTDLAEMSVSVDNDNVGFWYVSGAWDVYNTHEPLGGTGEAYAGYYNSNRYWSGYRFTLSGAIPSGATITSATMKLYGFSTWQWDNTTAPQDYLRIYVTDAANPGQITTTAARPAADSGSTTLYPAAVASGTRWPASNGLLWPVGYNTSVNFSSLIQYLVNTYSGLASAAHVQVWVTEDASQTPSPGGNTESEVGMYFAEKGSSYYPKLNISYTDPTKILMGKGTDAYELTIDSSLNVTGYLNTSNTVITQITKAWHHVSLTYDGSLLKLFIDGILKSSTAATGAVTTNATDFKIGQNVNGQFDEVKLYNYARSTKEIVQDMNASHPAVGSPLGSSIGYWKFDEGYGSTIHNSGSLGSTLDGSLGAGGSAPSWTSDGKYGKALLNSTGKYSSVPFDTALNLSQNEFTYSAWVNPTTINDYHMIIGQVIPYLNITNTGNIQFSNKINGSQVDVTSISALSTNQWYQIVASVDTQGYIKIYLNGKLDTVSGPYAGGLDLQPTYGIYFGAWDHWATFPFLGYIDDAKYYNYALSADEVRLDYNHGSAIVLGSLSSGIGNTAPSSAASQQYCVPGDTVTCSPPVGEWNFEEGSGGTANDTSGNGNTGTLGTGSSAPSWSTGKIGKGLNFDGVNDKVVVNDSSSLDFSATDSFSISAWTKTTTTTESYIFAKYKALSAPKAVILMGLKNTSKFNVELRGNTYTNLFEITSDKNINDNSWHNVALVYDNPNDKVYLYIDGKLDKSSAWTGDGSMSTDTPNAIGATWNDAISGYGGFYAGQIDQVKVYNYARSPAQIAWDYNRGNPVAFYKMDECQGSSIHDSSGLGNNGTLSIGATAPQTTAGTCTDGSAASAWYNGVTGKFNASLNLDGADDKITLPAIGIGTSYPFSISGWIKTSTNYSDLVSLLFAKNTSNSNPSLWCGLNSSEIAWFSQRNDAGTEGSATGVKVLNDGQWHHLSCVAESATSRKIFVDGKLEGSNTTNITTPISGLNNYTIGSGYYNGSYYYYLNGQIDDVQIFNYALTSQQVKLLYNQNSAVRFGPSSGSP